MIQDFVTTEFIYASYYILGVIFYIFVDRQLSKKFEGRYYLIHSMNNAVITYCTFPAIIHSFTDIDNFYSYRKSVMSTILTASLHSYHIVEYKDKLTYYDYLHHVTMCVVALPLGAYINSGSLLDYGLFFLTGLPGMVDYMMMFLVRNDKMKKNTQKMINNYINLWIRCPGCVSQATLTTYAYINAPNDVFDDTQRAMVLATIILVFWNGIYFMDLVVKDYARVEFIQGKKTG